MADPRKELADIVVPLAPPVGSADAAPIMLAGAAVLALIVAGGLGWWWVRRRPARVLRAIARAAARRDGDVDELAARLDRWARARFRLARLDVASPPLAVDAKTWARWVADLARLRFGERGSDDHTTLTALCHAAQPWGRRA